MLDGRRQRVTTALTALAVLALSACAQQSPGSSAPPSPSPSTAMPTSSPTASPTATATTSPTPSPSAAPTAAAPELLTVALDDWITLSIPADWTARDAVGGGGDFSSHEVLDEDGVRVLQMYYDRGYEASESLGCLPAVVESAQLEQQPLPRALPDVAPEEQVSRVTTVVGFDRTEGDEETAFAWEIRASLQAQEQIRGPECALPSAMYLSTGGIVQVSTAVDGVVFPTREDAEQYAASDEFRTIAAALDSVQLTP